MAIDPSIPLKVLLPDAPATLSGIRADQQEYEQGELKKKQQALYNANLDLQNQQLSRQVQGQKDVDESIKLAMQKSQGAPATDQTVDAPPPVASPTAPPPPVPDNATQGLNSPQGPSSPPSTLQNLLQVLPPGAGGAAPPAPMPQTQGSPVAPMPQMGATPQGTPAKAGGLSAVMPNWDVAVNELYRRGRGPEAIALQNSINANQKNLLDLRKAQLDHDSKMTETIGQVLGAATDQASYNAALGTLKNFGVPTQGIPPVFDPVTVKRFVQQGLTIQQQLEAHTRDLDNLIKTNKEGREEDLFPSQKRTAEATAAKDEAQAVLEQAKAALTKLKPEDWASQVDNVAPPGTNPAYNAMIKSRIAFAARSGDVDGAKKILDEAAEYTAAPGKAAAVASATAPIQIATDVAKETNPRVLAARTQQAVTTAKALREGDNPALAGVPPAAVASATSAATKLDLDYAKAKASADSIETVLKLAGAGNKAAGANASLVGVGAVNAVNGIKRINSAEIAQYGTAGSLLDKIQGKLQGWTEGQPIPKDVLNDMQALHTALRGSSYQQYTDGLNSINQRYGSKFGPTAPNPTAALPVPPTLKSQFPADVWARDPQGQLHHAPKGQALPQGWNAVN